MAGHLLSRLALGPTLIVSLPANSLALAQAAVAGGADALKVHIHVHHDASGTQFGTLAQERENLAAILGLGLPVGIVPGAGASIATREEMHELAEMGVDFFDFYAHDTPAWLAHFSKMTRAIAINSVAERESLTDLEALGFEILEAAIIPHEGYGRPLTAADLAAYRLLRRSTRLPIILPTQRAIQPEEVSILTEDLGIEALMIGAIVTGREPDSLRTATARYAAAIRS